MYQTDLCNVRFGMLTAKKLDHYHIQRNGRKKSAIWECLCDCGKTTLVHRCNLISGNTISCGCHRTSIMAHGIHDKYGEITQTPDGKRHYRLWLRKKLRDGMCDEWLNYMNYYKFHFDPSVNAIRLSRRIDCSKPWAPDNCVLK